MKRDLKHREQGGSWSAALEPPANRDMSVGSAADPRGRQTHRGPFPDPGTGRHRTPRSAQDKATQPARPLGGHGWPRVEVCPAGAGPRLDIAESTGEPGGAALYSFPSFQGRLRVPNTGPASWPGIRVPVTTTGQSGRAGPERSVEMA